MADHLVRCLLRGVPVRVVAATTGDLAAEMARRHGAVAGAAVALARASTAGLLLATLTKGDERVTLQILGDGPLGGVTVDANDAGDVRAYLKAPGAFVPGAAAVGGRARLDGGLGRQGLVNVIRDLGMRERYTGQVQFVSGEVDEDVERYLNESEQIVSALGCDGVLGADGSLAAAGGVLVQCMPGDDPVAAVAARLIAGARERLRGGALAGALRAPEIAGSAEALACAALGVEPDALERRETQGARFRCPCSEERVVAALALLSDGDLAAMARDGEGASVTCAFCATRYHIAPDKVEALHLERQRTPRGSS